MLGRLQPGGILVMAVDFYNFELRTPGPHLPKNFVYGGVMQMALEAVGMRKLTRRASHWFETAAADAVLWQRPIHLRLSEAELTRGLREETRALLRTFRAFYDEEIDRQGRGPI